jgi:pimeloyl-ACP methyl ester carboxylesterase
MTRPPRSLEPTHADKTFYRPVSGGDWRLDVCRYARPDRLQPDRKPVVMIPGYAMNTFVLGFHPTGRSMVDYLVDQGFEIWTANLRGQGESRRLGPDGEYGFRELACEDLPVVRDLVLEETATERHRFDAIGCSLGASFLYAYLAHHLDDHRMGALVAIGGPLRWEDVHPLVRLVFSSPLIADILPTRGVPTMARVTLPLIERLPLLASIYMNVHQIELEEADRLVQTIDNPNPGLNRQIAHWLDDRDMIVDGVDVTEAMAEVDIPVFCILANHDGIVPPSSVLSIAEAIGSDVVDILRVGTEDHWFAHADLFISEYAEDRVFDPLARWLERQNVLDG